MRVETCKQKIPPTQQLLLRGTKIQVLSFFKSFPEQISYENRITLEGPFSIPFLRLLPKIHLREA